MQSPAINPNLAASPAFSFKDILVGKLVRAICCSVVSQVVILFIYVIVANVNVFNPFDWLNSILNTFTKVSTWIFVIIFLLIIFAQCLICAKDYVLMSSYSSTRFQQVLHVFSVHNFVLLSLHVIIGAALTWQSLVIGDSSNKHLTENCNHRLCLVGDTFFLIIGGFWTGLYFFLKVYVSTKQLVFPVVQQRKFLSLRTNISLLFKESLVKSIWPTIYFALFYYVWGDRLENNFMHIASLGKASRESSILIYVYLWWFSTLYFFSMNLMRFFLSMFLTETVQFPISKDNTYILTLQEALVMYNLPIVQHLACLDLYFLSLWSPMRRQLFFTLSRPGNHPYNWNTLVENVANLFTNYTDLIKKSSDINLTQQKLEPTPEAYVPFSPLTSPFSQASKFGNIRNLSVQNWQDDNVVDVTHEPRLQPFELIKNKTKELHTRIVNFLKMFFGINFLFGELPQVNIQKCLSNGRLIIWASQGISSLAVASLTEDKHGIVQKDLPVIITSLVQLKQCLDKLNKMPSLSKRAASDANYKMKMAIIAAVKKSLFNICLHFGQYFKDLPLNQEVVRYLHANNPLTNFN